MSLNCSMVYLNSLAYAFKVRLSVKTSGSQCEHWPVRHIFGEAQKDEHLSYSGVDQP